MYTLKTLFSAVVGSFVKRTCWSLSNKRATNRFFVLSYVKCIVIRSNIALLVLASKHRRYLHKWLTFIRAARKWHGWANRALLCPSWIKIIDGMWREDTGVALGPWLVSLWSPTSPRRAAQRRAAQRSASGREIKLLKSGTTSSLFPRLWLQSSQDGLLAITSINLFHWDYYNTVHLDRWHSSIRMKQ